MDIRKKLRATYKHILRNKVYGSIFLLIEKLFGYPFEKRKFRKYRGYPLNLTRPRTYTEKIVWKKLFDRNPLLRVTADKYRVRSYLEQRLVKERAAEILIPLLHVTDKPETIPFDELPESYIIKANHGSRWNIVVDGEEINRKAIIATCRSWLSSYYDFNKHEWAYRDIPRKIVIEELLKDEQGKIPRDFKFFIFHGTCRKVMVFFDRYNDPLVSSYDRNWNLLPQSSLFKNGPDMEKPKTFEKMLALAEELGQDFDFVRVDLYTIGDRVYFGEFTHYSYSGTFMQMDLENDLETGKWWNIEKNPYWVGEQNSSLKDLFILY